MKSLGRWRKAAVIMAGQMKMSLENQNLDPQSFERSRLFNSSMIAIGAEKREGRGRKTRNALNDGGFAVKNQPAFGRILF